MKCCFLIQNYLDAEGIVKDKKTVEVILNVAEIKYLTEVKAFTSMINYTMLSLP